MRLRQPRPKYPALGIHFTCRWGCSDRSYQPKLSPMQHLHGPKENCSRPLKQNPTYMNIRKFVASLFFALSVISTAFAQGTGFTYQGRLNDGASPANGSYDLTFALFDVPSGGSALAGPLTNSATAVSNGLFTVTLDLGANFPGADRWLEIAVRTNGPGS